MLDSAALDDLEFGGPAHYRIVVQGVLDDMWRERLAGLSVTTVERGARAAHTVLVGHIRDQAELRGVIETLHGLHLPILRVEQVTDQIGVGGDPTTNNDDQV